MFSALVEGRRNKAWITSDVVFDVGIIVVNFYIYLKWKESVSSGVQFGSVFALYINISSSAKFVSVLESDTGILKLYVSHNYAKTLYLLLNSIQFIGISMLS